MTAPFIREEFECISDLVRAEMRRSLSGGADIDPRLVYEATATGANSSTPSEGNALVGTDHSMMVWEIAQAISRILGLTRKLPITGKTNKLRLPTVNEKSRVNGSRSGGMALAWLDEAQTFPQSRPEFADRLLIAKLLAGVLYVSNELLSDSPAFNSWFPVAVGRELAFMTEDSILNGTGAGQPLGLLRSDALITITPESGQAAGTLRAENCARMAARLWSASYDSPGTAWVTSNDGFYQLESQRKANGTPLVEYVGGQRLIMGWPVIVSEHAQPLGSVGDLILADFGEYIISERESGIVGSIHLRYLSDESALRVKTRVDGQLGWSSPVIPKTGGATQSPAITLDAR